MVGVSWHCSASGVVVNTQVQARTLRITEEGDWQGSQEARGKRQEARGKRQEARGKTCLGGLGMAQSTTERLKVAKRHWPIKSGEKGRNLQHRQRRQLPPSEGCIEAGC